MTSTPVYQNGQAKLADDLAALRAEASALMVLGYDLRKRVDATLAALAPAPTNGHHLDIRSNKLSLDAMLDAWTAERGERAESYLYGAIVRRRFARKLDRRNGEGAR